MLSEQIFQEVIMDHYRNPRNFGKLENPDICFRDSNPACADVIEININVDGENIKEIKFNGQGCAISMATASMITEHVNKLDDVKNLDKEGVLEMLGIPLSGMRLKCALLPLKVLKCGVYKYLGENSENDS